MLNCFTVTTWILKGTCSLNHKCSSHEEVLFFDNDGFIISIKSTVQKGFGSRETYFPRIAEICEAGSFEI